MIEIIMHEALNQVFLENSHNMFGYYVGALSCYLIQLTARW